MKTTLTLSAEKTGNIPLKKILLSCGIIASLQYAIMMMVFAYPGYSIITQTVSELSAIGTATRPLWMALGFIYMLLMIAFAAGLWISSGENRPLRIMALILLFVYGVLGFIWPFASMHQRDVLAAGGGNYSDILHLVLGAITVPSNMIMVGLGIVALGKKFRFYSIISLALLVIFAILTGLEAPHVPANMPTPLIGVWERLNIVVFLSWIIVLSLGVMRLQTGQHRTLHDAHAV